MTDLQRRALISAPLNSWFVVSELRGLNTSLGAAGAAVRHMAKAGLLEKQWADREQRFNKRVWCYRLTEAGRKARKLLERERP